MLSDLNVYYGFSVEQQVFRDQQPRQSKFDTATDSVKVNGANSLVCLAGSTCGISNAADNVLENYATVASIASVGGTNCLRLHLNGTGGAACNQAGIVLAAADFL